MTDIEKEMCNDILRYGTIKRDEEFECEGERIRQYTIEQDGEEYDLTKVNGEWIYFHHTIH